MRKLVLLTVVALMAVAMLAVPVSAGPAKDMATGDGNWISAGGNDYYVEFNAQTATDKQDAKGTLYQAQLDEYGTIIGEFWVDIDTVSVYSDYAKFAGTTHGSWGTLSGRDNQTRWTYVWDGGSGPDEVGDDYLKGNWTDTDPNYPSSPNDAWYAGNVQLHYWE